MIAKFLFHTQVTYALKPSVSITQEHRSLLLYSSFARNNTTSSPPLLQSCATSQYPPHANTISSPLSTPPASIPTTLVCKYPSRTSAQHHSHKLSPLPSPLSPSTSPGSIAHLPLLPPYNISNPSLELIGLNSIHSQAWHRKSQIFYYPSLHDQILSKGMLLIYFRFSADRFALFTGVSEALLTGCGDKYS